jgi:hypothetical protein
MGRALIVYHGNKFGQPWLHIVNGQIYVWMGLRWIPTGRFPYGANPMDF